MGRDEEWMRVVVEAGVVLRRQGDDVHMRGLRPFAAVVVLGAGKEGLEGE